MPSDPKIPPLLDIYFGEAASTAQKGINKRFRQWSRAFDGWIADCKARLVPQTARHSLCVWRRFARKCDKPPWEVTQEDIEKYAAWMLAEGFAPNTVINDLSILGSFYRWCEAHAVDAACGAGFNPVRAAVRWKDRLYENSRLWSREEIDALLKVLGQDSSALGRREHAFFLARLRLGISTGKLKRLQWGQLEQCGKAAAVRWRENSAPQPLEDEVWQAVLEYLRASGRLEGMQVGYYIFAPLREPLKTERGSLAQDWAEDRCLSEDQPNVYLKLYGRRAGIAEEKLTVDALRLTAIRSRLEQGESPEGMRLFLDSLAKLKEVKRRMRRLAQAPASQGQPQGDIHQARPPDREPRRYQEGDNFKYGLFARSLPSREVQDVLAEDIQGVDQEIAALRTLMRSLVERRDNLAQRGDAYTQAASRLAELLALEQKEGTQQDPWVEQILKFVDEAAASQGEPPASPRIRQEALQGEPRQGVGSRELAEEVATTRLVLRNLFRLAQETGSTLEYIRLVNLYGLGCVRLVKLLKAGSESRGRLKQYLKEMIEQALRQVAEGLSLE